MFTLIPTNQFKKDLKTLKNRSAKNPELIIDFLPIQASTLGYPNCKCPHLQ